MLSRNIHDGNAPVPEQLQQHPCGNLNNNNVAQVSDRARLCLHQEEGYNGFHP